MFPKRASSASQLTYLRTIRLANEFTSWQTDEWTLLQTSVIKVLVFITYLYCVMQYKGQR